MNRYLLIAIIVVIVVGGWSLIQNQKSQVVGNAPITTLPYGETTLKVGERGVFEEMMVTVLEVIEDSRCPQGVVCIWAGTVKVSILVETSYGAITRVVELNNNEQVNNFEIKLVSVSPETKAGSSIVEKDYSFIFDVVKKEVPTVVSPNSGKCYIGGCSSQICSDQPDIVTTCEYMEKYACYRTAKCERQTTGECDWTETVELKMCLANPPAF